MENFPEIKTPHLAVDAVIIYPNFDIVVIERKFPPLGIALPGGFVDIGETTINACIREAKEEVGLDVRPTVLIGVFDEPDRDPRRHVASVAWLCEPLNPEQKPVASDDAKNVKLINWNDHEWPDFVFDHEKIISRGVNLYLKSSWVVT